MTKLKGAKVLVTGGAGFIGSELVRLLAAEGAGVRVVDNLVNGKRENLVGVPEGSFEFLKLDIREEGALRHALSGVDIVYHLACLGVRHSLHSPRENHDVNATATLQLLKHARDVKVGRFVNVSTSEVYGTARQVPMTEDHPTYPTTVYGGSKLAGEHYTLAYFHSYGFPTVVVRPFNTYGPRCHHEGDSGEVIPKFLLRSIADLPMIVFGDGMQTRDFTYVTDTAQGILLAGIADAALGETINLGSKHEISILDLAKEVAQVAGTKVSIVHEAPRPADTLRLYADNTKAASLLGYHPTVSFREGLTRLKDWYLASGRSIEELLKEEVVLNWKARDGKHET